MSHSPATPSEWQPDTDATGPLPLDEGGQDVAAGGDRRTEPWDDSADATWQHQPSEDGPLPEGEGEFVSAEEFAERDEVETTAAQAGATPIAIAADDGAAADPASPAAQVAPLTDTDPTTRVEETHLLALGGADPESVGHSEPSSHEGTDAHEGADAPVAESSDSAAATETSAGSAQRKPLIILAAGLAVVLVIAGIVWAVISTTNSNRDKAIAQTATTYLNALADADATAALATLADKPTNQTLLTSTVLADSRDAAPLRDIQIGAPTFDGGTTATVPAHYTLGDQPVSTTLHLEGDGRTQWLLSDGTADLTLSATKGLLVNTAKVTETTNPVFPGTYRLTTGTTDLTLEGASTAVLTTPDAPTATLTAVPALSEAGKTKTLDTVKGRFDECLAATEARPANCPFGVRTDDVEVTPGSVKFALVNDPWAGFAPTLDLATLTATGQISYEIDATATVARNGLTTEGTVRVARPVTYTVTLGDNPKVTWS